MQKLFYRHLYPPSPPRADPALLRLAKGARERLHIGRRAVEFPSRRAVFLLRGT